jgi:8-oxo-dGTP pyrophosphatase MutT (NUDIX family)
VAEPRKRKRSDRLVASVAAYDPRGRLLFGLREDNKRWTLPGGHLEEGEDPRDGAVRELREETGLEPAGEVEYLGHGLVRRESGDVRVFAYRVEVDGEPHGRDDPDGECATWRWVDVSGGVPADIVGNLHSRLNVTLRLLGLQEGELRKYEPARKTFWRVQHAADPISAGWRSQIGHDEDGLGHEAGTSACYSLDHLKRWARGGHANWIGDMAAVEFEGDHVGTGADGEPVVRPTKELRRIPFKSTHERPTSLAIQDLDSFDGGAALAKAEPPEDLTSIYAPATAGMPAADPHRYWHRDAGFWDHNVVEREQQRQLAVWAALRKPEDSDVDHMLRHPDPAQRSLALKMPGVERRHIRRAAGDPHLREEARKHPEVDARMIAEMLAEDPVRYDWNALIWHPAVDSSHLRQLARWSPGGPSLVGAAFDVPSMWNHPKMDEATFLAALRLPAVDLEKRGGAHGNFLAGTKPDDARSPSVVDWSQKISAETLHRIARDALGDELHPNSRTALEWLLPAVRSIKPETAQLVFDMPAAYDLHMALARNPATPPEAISRLADHRRITAGQLSDGAVNVREAALRNPSAPKSVYDHALRDPVPRIRKVLADAAEAGELTLEQEQSLARDNDHWVRQALAEKTRRPEVLRVMYDDGMQVENQHLRHEVVLPVLRNPALPDDVVDRVLDDAEAYPQATYEGEIDRVVALAARQNALKPEHLRRILALRAPVNGTTSGFVEAQKGILKSQASRIQPEWLDPMVDSSDPDVVHAVISAAREANVGGIRLGALPITSEQLVRASRGEATNVLNEAHRVAMRHSRFPKSEARRIALDPNEDSNKRILGLEVAGPEITSEDLARITEGNPRSLSAGDISVWAAVARHPSASSATVGRVIQHHAGVAWDLFEHHPEVLAPEHVEWALSRANGWPNVVAAAVGHRHATPQMVEALVEHGVRDDKDHRIIMAAINSGKLSPATMKKIAGGDRRFSTDHARLAHEILAKESPDSVFQERTAPKMGVAKLRKVRDLILSHPGRTHMRPKDLPPGDWSAGRGPDGDVHADKLQAAIDAAESAPYNVSHATWDGLQRHSGATSKVFQLNLTDDHVQRMKAAGVYGTFRNVQEASVQSGHPVSRTHGVGWVRYTGTPKSGLFIDEVQSDLGQSLVKQAAAQAREAGQDEAEATARAAKKYPDDHLDLIKKIVFGGRHPSEVLHEAFLQHLRDRGHHDAKVAIHTVESKAPISLGRPLPKKCAKCGGLQGEHRDTPAENGIVTHWPGHLFVAGPAGNNGCAGVNGETCGRRREGHVRDLSVLSHPFEPGAADKTKAPAHFQVGYDQVPKKLGYEPSSYGKLRAETNKERRGQPTWGGKVRKAESDPSVARKFESDLAVWVATQPLAKAAPTPAADRGEYVDDSAEDRAHPPQLAANAALFVSAVPDPVVPGPKAVYDVQDAAGRARRFVARPYHPRSPAANRGRPGLGGWAEMTSQALYHAAGVGDLHEPVHASRTQRGDLLVVASLPDRAAPPAEADQDQGRRDQADQVALMDWLCGLERSDVRHDLSTGSLVSLDHRRAFQYREQQSKPVISGVAAEWWEKHAPAVKAAMGDRVGLIRDPDLRARVLREFDGRASALSQ